MSPNFIMHYLYANEIQASIEYYTALGFELERDTVDGFGTRHVKMRYPEFPNALIALEDFPDLLSNSSSNVSRDSHPLRVAFTIVTEQYQLWTARFEAIGARPALEIIEPYGIWVYYLDPARNLICISNKSLW